MGTVSTALSEEAFAKCITKCIYQTATADVGAAGCSDDEADIRCGICQVVSSLPNICSCNNAFVWMCFE